MYKGEGEAVGFGREKGDVKVSELNGRIARLIAGFADQELSLGFWGKKADDRQSKSLSGWPRAKGWLGDPSIPPLDFFDKRVARLPQKPGFIV